MNNQVTAALQTFIDSFRYKGSRLRFWFWCKIQFTPPTFQTGELHPDTRCKFVSISSFPLPEGIFGPFYRYTPRKTGLIADNDTGGYFTDQEFSCAGCAKFRLWLFDKERKYFYDKEPHLYRQECYFIIDNPRYATIFTGNAAYGGAFQIRPNNWIFDQRKGNKIVYANSVQLAQQQCPDCSAFLAAFTP